MNRVQDICAELDIQQRHRVVLLKSRIMLENRRRNIVASHLGYDSDLPKKEINKKFKEADQFIADVLRGRSECDPFLAFNILLMEQPIQSINQYLDGYRDANKNKNIGRDQLMEELAMRLPIAPWVRLPEQRGLGFLSLAQIIGETHNLDGYDGIAKVWARMACHPYTHHGQTRMASTWRSGKEGSLTAEAWTEYGYCPRRRALMYVIGENLVKLNGDGPYRARYLDAKVKAFAAHPEWNWSKCTTCKGRKKIGRKLLCTTCGGTGKKCKRAHLHGILLAGKLLLKNLRIAWGEYGGVALKTQPWREAG